MSQHDPHERRQRANAFWNRFGAIGTAAALLIAFLAWRFPVQIGAPNREGAPASNATPSQPSTSPARAPESQPPESQPPADERRPLAPPAANGAGAIDAAPVSAASAPPQMSAAEQRSGTFVSLSGAGDRDEFGARELANLLRNDQIAVAATPQSARSIVVVQAAMPPSPDIAEPDGYHEYAKLVVDIEDAATHRSLARSAFEATEVDRDPRRGKSKALAGAIAQAAPFIAAHLS